MRLAWLAAPLLLSGCSLPVKDYLSHLAVLLGVTPGEALGGIGSVLGALIGALGAGVAVVLTLVLQRRDERSKISRAVQREVIEFTRIAMGNLETCENIRARKVTIPLNNFPATMAMPKPIIYPAVADRLGRLQAGRGQRIVTFFARISEIETVVAVIGAQTQRVPIVVTPEDVKHVAEAWIHVIYDIARRIVAEETPEPALDTAVRKEILKQIDETCERARQSSPPEGADK